VIVLSVIGITGYITHATRLDIIAHREALTAAQELSERKWHQFFKANPNVVIPRRFFTRETIEEIEARNEVVSSTLPEREDNGEQEPLVVPEPLVNPVEEVPRLPENQ